MASLHDKKLDGKYTDYYINEEVQHFLNRILSSLQYSSNLGSFSVFLGAS